jgi:hypothetical protein
MLEFMNGIINMYVLIGFNNMKLFISYCIYVQYITDNHKVYNCIQYYIDNNYIDIILVSLYTTEYIIYKIYILYDLLDLDITSHMECINSCNTITDLYFHNENRKHNLPNLYKLNEFFTNNKINDLKLDRIIIDETFYSYLQFVTKLSILNISSASRNEQGIYSKLNELLPNLKQLTFTIGLHYCYNWCIKVDKLILQYGDLYPYSGGNIDLDITGIKELVIKLPIKHNILSFYIKNCVNIYILFKDETKRKLKIKCHENSTVNSNRMELITIE